MQRFILFLLCLLLVPSLALAEGKKPYGLHESVIIPGLSSAPIKAKLDTGAETSSLGAGDISLFKKDGADWVRFTPQIAGAKEMEMPVTRHSRIKRRADGTGESASLQRPVVMLEICFDGKKHSMEANLADRSRFTYPLLIGSNALISFGAVVDPALSHRAAVSCP